MSSLRGLVFTRVHDTSAIYPCSTTASAGSNVPVVGKGDSKLAEANAKAKTDTHDERQRCDTVPAEAARWHGNVNALHGYETATTMTVAASDPLYGSW